MLERRSVAVFSKTYPPRKCRKPGCKAVFTPKSANRKFCDEHSSNVAYRGKSVGEAKRKSCPACHDKRLHAPGELKKHHPFAGHGYNREQGWSHPDLKSEAEAAKR